RNVHEHTSRRERQWRAVNRDQTRTHDVSAHCGRRHKCADRFPHPAHPKQLPQRRTFRFWKEDPPRNRIKKYRHREMESHHCRDSPACGSEGCADLRQALANEENGEERSSSQSKQPHGHMYFAQCFHSFSETIRAGVRRCAYPEREQIYAEQRPDQLRNLCTGGCVSSTRTKIGSLTTGT